MTRIHLIVAVAAASGWLIAAPAAAEAGRVAVLSVQGDPDGELEDGLVSIVEDRHDLVTSGEFERTARRAGVEDMDADGIGKIARKLDADAVIEGQLSREDEGFTLVVRIRAQSGKTIKKITVDLAKPRLSAKAKRRLGTGVLDGVDRVLGIAGDGGEDDDEAEADEKPKKKAKKAKKAKKQAREDARELAREDDEDDGEDEDAEAEDDAEDDDAGDDEDRVAVADDDDDLELRSRDRDDDDEDGAMRDPRRPAVRIFAGASAKARNLAFTVRPDLEEALVPNGTTTTFVPGARAAAELYPMAFGGKTDTASNLGVAFEFDQTLTLNTQTSDAPDQKFPTKQRHWSVGVRYRWVTGDKPTMPTVTLGVGYGRRAFQVDRSQLAEGAEIDFPDTDYRYIDPGMNVRLPLGARLALEAGAKAYFVRKAGAIQNESEYGGAKITGLAADGGVEIKLTKQAVFALTASWAQIGFDFIGNGQQSNGRDGDLMSQDVGGAMDRYIGVAGTLGFAY